MLCSAVALSEADLAVRMHDMERPGTYRLHMLVALVWAGLAGAWLIVGLNGGYTQSTWIWWVSWRSYGCRNYWHGRLRTGRFATRNKERNHDEGAHYEYGSGGVRRRHGDAFAAIVRQAGDGRCVGLPYAYMPLVVDGCGRIVR